MGRYFFFRAEGTWTCPSGVNPDTVGGGLWAALMDLNRDANGGLQDVSTCPGLVARPRPSEAAGLGCHPRRKAPESSLCAESSGTSDLALPLPF